MTAQEQEQFDALTKESIELSRHFQQNHVAHRTFVSERTMTVND